MRPEAFDDMSPPVAGSLRGAVRRRVAVAVLGVCLIAAMAVAGIERGAWILRRADHSYVQLGLAHRLEAEIGAYVLAETQRRFQGALPPAEAEATRALETLAAYRARAEAEVAMVVDPMERAREAQEIERAAALGRMLEALRETFARDRAGGGGIEDEAARGAALSDLSAAVRLSIAEAVSDEAEEAEQARAAMAGLQRDALAFAVAAAVLAAVLAAALATGLHRAILRPLGALADGVRAFGDGAKGLRIAAPLPAEFAPLAARFNAMAARIEAQQTALEAANAALQDEVAARTAELRAANARLAAVDESRRRFLADVSHEMRTPLTVLMGEAEVALRGPPDPAALRAACERIVANGGFLRRRFDDLMRLARSEEGALTLAREAVDLAAVAREAAAFAAGYARARGVRLEAGGHDAPCLVTGDADALRQAALAVIDNALKHSPEGGRVDVAVLPEAGMARLTVADEGKGFDPARKSLMFERYGRAGPGGEGQGLGLAIARWIAESHGGAIDARPRPSGGSEFMIELPLRAP